MATKTGAKKTSARPTKGKPKPKPDDVAAGRTEAPAAPPAEASPTPPAPPATPAPPPTIGDAPTAWQPLPTPAPVAPSPAPPPLPGAPMPPEAAPSPTPKTAPAPQWTVTSTPATPTAAGPAATPLTATPPQTREDLWLRRVAARRGHPGFATLGWSSLVLGLIVLTYGYLRTFQDNASYTLGGVRSDYVAAVLILIGAVVAAVFAFVPAHRATRFHLEATTDELEEEARGLQTQILVYQILTGIGLGLIVIGFLWSTYWIYSAYTADAADLYDSFVGGRAIKSHYLGIVIAIVGLLLVLAFAAPIPSLRKGRAHAVLAMLRAAPRAPAAEATPVGVPTEDIQRLMKRLDGLMAQLPDSAVSEFSKTPEADTYLKLLGP